MSIARVLVHLILTKCAKKSRVETYKAFTAEIDICRLTSDFYFFFLLASYAFCESLCIAQQEMAVVMPVLLMIQSSFG